jgi:hypothetical protein
MKPSGVLLVVGAAASSSKVTMRGLGIERVGTVLAAEGRWMMVIALVELQRTVAVDMLWLWSIAPAASRAPGENQKPL